MKLKKFSKEEVIFNTIKAHPQFSFRIGDENIYLNNISSSNSNVPNGYISAYDISVNRVGDERIYQFLDKDSDYASFKTTSDSAYSSALYGTQYKTYLPLTSSISSEIGTDFTHLKALKNIIDYYRKQSPYFDYDTYFEGEQVRLYYIPSIFYGSSIKRGSVRLEYLYTGSLAAVLEDSQRNGVLLETTGTNIGAVGGIILYNEGVVGLFGTASLGTDVVDGYDSGNVTGTLIDFGDTVNTVTKTGYNLVFKGTTYTPTITMFAHAEQNELNQSNNPTFISGNYFISSSFSSSILYNEPNKTIKNITKSPYTNYNSAFIKTTFISKIAIYDENKQLIGIAHLAEPIKKTEDLSYTFKIKIDL